MKPFFTIVFAFLSISFAFGQQTYIPDSNFEQALIFEGLDTVLDNSIPTSVIDTLTVLGLEPFGIVDLTGIEDFVSLKSLVCRNNDIQQLDLTNNTALQFLNCENNFITSLNVTNCHNLTEIRGENNNLTSINLTQNPLLEALELNQNGLGSINLANNTLLKSLRLVNTSLTSIDLSNNDLLEVLDVSTNQLTALDVINMANLEALLVTNNSVSQLDLSNNPNLELLFAASNDLTGLDLQNNPLLTGITCMNNNLASLILPPINTSTTCGLGTINNPDLFCVQCDNPTYVNSNWNINLDSFTQISNDCSLGLIEHEVAVEIFPNPTENGRISVKVEANGLYRLIDVNGAILQEGEIKKGTTVLDFLAFGYGTYVLQLNIENQLITKIVEFLY